MEPTEIPVEIPPPYDTLVLSGGGVKGFYILGGIQAAIDSGLLCNIKTYVGTSIGAMISYLLCIGYTPIEIVVNLYINKWLEKMQHFDLVAMISGNGATNFTNIHEALEKLTIDKMGKLFTLGKLREQTGKTLICVTYNMTTCVTEYLGPDNYADLPCVTALRMSANIPLVFDRFKYMDNFYVDGGISDNFPLSKGIELGNSVFGIYLEIPEKNLKDNPEDGVVAYILRLLQIPVTQAVRYKINCITEEAKNIPGKKILVVPIKIEDMKNSMVEFDIKSKVRLEMFSIGYRHVKEFLI